MAVWDVLIEGRFLLERDAQNRAGADLPHGQRIIAQALAAATAKLQAASRAIMPAAVLLIGIT